MGLDHVVEILVRKLFCYMRLDLLSRADLSPDFFQLFSINSCLKIKLFLLGTYILYRNIELRNKANVNIYLRRLMLRDLLRSFTY